MLTDLNEALPECSPILIRREGGLRGQLHRHWLEYDAIAVSVLLVGIGLVELLAFSI